MNDVVVEPATAHVRLSPDGYHLFALDYYNAYLSFARPPDRLSPVPYSLLCQSIELELKSRHLRANPETTVGDKFGGHKLDRTYSQLPEEEKLLTAEQVQTLRKAAKAYDRKMFHYWQPKPALRGYRDFPDLTELDTIARALLFPRLSS